MRELIIIGGGAAALSAGMYALGKQLDFLMIYESLGGKAGWRQNIIGQEEVEYLAGEEAVRIFERKIAMQTDRTIRDTVLTVQRAGTGFRVETRTRGAFEAMAVIVATGATPVRLNAPGAQELLGQGLGYSVTTHAHLLAGKTAAVIGSTHRALRGVAELARTAEKVYLIIPDPNAASLPMMHAVSQRQNVEILTGYAVDEVAGPMNVEEIVVSRDGQQRRIAVDAAFADLGLHPCSECVQHLVRTDQDGFIWVDERMATTVPGIFAAGDVTTSFGEQVLIAIGDGARAALGAYDYLLMRAPVVR